MRRRLAKRRRRFVAVLPARLPHHRLITHVVGILCERHALYAGWPHASAALRPSGSVPTACAASDAALAIHTLVGTPVRAPIECAQRALASAPPSLRARSRASSGAFASATRSTLGGHARALPLGLELARHRDPDPRGYAVRAPIECAQRTLASCGLCATRLAIRTDRVRSEGSPRGARMSTEQ